MIIPPIVAAITQAYNTWSQNKANEENVAAQRDINNQNLAYATQTRDLQRQWANEDWARTNQYNHPLEQMNRLRQAGLNPNLVYGKGADNTAVMVRGSQSPSYEGRMYEKKAITLDPIAMQAITMGYLNTKKLQAETDNLYQQNAVLKAQKEKTQLEAKAQSIENFKAAQNMPIETEQLRSSVEKTDAETQKIWTENNKIAQEALQIVQNMDIAKERRAAELENLLTKNEQMKQSMSVELSQEERNRVMHSTNVAKTLVEIALEKEKVISEKIKQSKDQAEIQKLEWEKQNLYFARVKIENETRLLEAERADYWIKSELMKSGIDVNNATVMEKYSHIIYGAINAMKPNNVIMKKGK